MVNYMLMKNIVTISIVVGSALVVGAGGGAAYKRFFAPADQEIVGFNPDYCKPDFKTLSDEVSKYGSKKEAAKSMRPYEVVNYAGELYKNCTNCFSYCYGLADTVVKQDIRNAQIKVGNEFFEEAISKSSMVGVGKRMYQSNTMGTTNLYIEKSAGDVSIDGDNVHTNFNASPEKLTMTEYKKAFGRNLPDMFIYVIHDMTVTKEELKELPNNEGYEVYLELDPVTGGYNYRYQMQTMSKLDKLPVFEYIHLTYTITPDLELKHLTANEKYKATMLGISPDIINTLDYEYFPNQITEIPEVTQDVNYQALRELRK